MGNNNFLLGKIWDDTLNKITDSNQVAVDSLEYFSGSKLIDLDGQKATIVVPGFIYSAIMNEYKVLIQDCLQQVTNGLFDIDIIIESQNKPKTTINSSNIFLTRTVDPNYTF